MFGCCVSSRPGQDNSLVETASEDRGTSDSSLTSGAALVGGEERLKEPDTLSLTSQASSVDTTSSVPISSLPIASSSLVSESSVVFGLSESTASKGGNLEGEGKGGEGRGRKEEGVRDTGVSSEEQSGLLVDTSELVSTEGEGEEGGGGEGGGGEGGKSMVFQDQQLLAEVFAGESGDIGAVASQWEEKEVKKKTGEGEEQKTGEDRGGNYSVELSSSDQLALLIQSSESNLARIRYIYTHSLYKLQFCVF